jgi:hypothetical protein
MIIDIQLTRNKFTKYGMHLNTSGKENMAKHTGQIITNLLNKQMRSTITLCEKEECELNTPEGTKLELKNVIILE